MRVLVLADSHGRSELLRKAVEAHPEAEAVIHLGDGSWDMEGLEFLPGQTVLQLRGNNKNDSRELPYSLHGDFGGVRYYACHGHRERIKFTDETVLEKAQKYGASLVLHGHIHSPSVETRGGVLLVDPGAVKYGCYAVLDITEQGVTPILMKIP